MNKYMMSFGTFGYLRGIDFLPPLLIRFYLFTVFWISGTTHLTSQTVQQETVAFLARIGFPSPEIWYQLLTAFEIVGALFLLLGFAVRWITIPLLSIVLIAAVYVHFPNGWLYIIEPNTQGPFYTEKTLAISERLTEIKEVLAKNEINDVDNLVVKNDGIETAMISFIMLLTLFFTGAGRFFSIDYFIYRRNMQRFCEHEEELERMEQEEQEPRIVEPPVVSPITSGYYNKQQAQKSPVPQTPHFDEDKATSSTPQKTKPTDSDSPPSGSDK